MNETYARMVGKQQAKENAELAWNKFQKMVKVIVNTPKQKKRKPKKKPAKKPQKKGA